MKSASPIFLCLVLLVISPCCPGQSAESNEGPSIEERIDQILDFHWKDTAEAPAFARWQFSLHFECIRTERWPLNFGHALGIIASPGSTVAVYFFPFAVDFVT